MLVKGRRRKKAGEELQWGLGRVGTYLMRSYGVWYYLLGVIGHLNQDARSSIPLSPHESLLRKRKWPSATEECPGRTTCVITVGCLGRGGHEITVFLPPPPLGRSSLWVIPFSFAALRKNFLKGWDTKGEGEHGEQHVITRVKCLGPEVSRGGLASGPAPIGGPSHLSYLLNSFTLHPLLKARIGKRAQSQQSTWLAFPGFVFCPKSAASLAIFKVE